MAPQGGCDSLNFGITQKAKEKDPKRFFPPINGRVTNLAKVQYVDVHHDEADIAFEGIRFHSAYGYLTVMADRSAIPQTALCLTIDTWKARSLGKLPHILTYGMEGLEGLRVGNSDALEVRIGSYYNYTDNAPGWNLRVALSQ